MSFYVGLNYNFPINIIQNSDKFPFFTHLLLFYVYIYFMTFYIKNMFI